MSAAYTRHPSESAVYTTALDALNAGISVVAIRADGSKAPVGAWDEYKHRRADEDEITRWYRTNPDYGLGFVCGAVSGNLEMLDFDNYAAYTAYKGAALQAGLGELVSRIESGYCEITPKPGVHWFYRCEEPIPGNTKLALRPKLAASGEVFLDNQKRAHVDYVLIETRGEGGQGVVAPSGGRVHPSGKAYRLLHGGAATIETITAQERADLLNLARSFDEMPAKEQEELPRHISRSDTGKKKPGDDFNERETWASILTPHGWSYIGMQGRTELWRRPGKDDGISATINHLGTDRFHVFTSSTDFEQETSYSKFGAYAVLEHGGDMAEAARELGRKGYGDQTPIAFRESPRPKPAALIKSVDSADDPPHPAEEPTSGTPNTTHIPFNDMGNAQRMIATFGANIRYAPGKGWLVWDRTRWIVDIDGQMARYAKQTVVGIYEEAARLYEQGKSDQAVEMSKWAIKCGNEARLTNMVKNAETEEAVLVSVKDLDKDPLLFNCINGTINLRTGELQPHDPTDLITKISPVAYNPDANCKVWETFLFNIMCGSTGEEGAIARAWRLVDFLQRTIGYTLTGLNTEEIVLLLVGNGGNGKSKMIETIYTMMGDYARQASFETFLEQRASDGGGAQENILKFMGARFVKASEPEAGKKLNTAKIKDLTGGETVNARGLYERHSIDFIPIFKLWLSMNKKPDVPGQDDGTWRRFKVVPFDMKYVLPHELEEKRNASAYPNRVMVKDLTLFDRLIDELPGVLAWAVRGCLDWQKSGIQPPTEVDLATEAYKEDNDVLAGFFSERVIRSRSKQIVYGEFYNAYVAYCETEDERPIKKKTFKQALEERGLVIQRGTENKIYVYGAALSEG